MDRINPNIITVQNAETGSDDLAVLPDGSADGFLRDRTVHGRNDGTVDRICHSLEVKQAGDPDIRDFVCEGDIRAVGTEFGIFKVECHDFGCVLDLVSAILQCIVKIRRNQRTDLKDCR